MRMTANKTMHEILQNLKLLFIITLRTARVKEKKENFLKNLKDFSVPLFKKFLITNGTNVREKS